VRQCGSTWSRNALPVDWFLLRLPAIVAMGALGTECKCGRVPILAHRTVSGNITGPMIYLPLIWTSVPPLMRSRAGHSAITDKGAPFFVYLAPAATKASTMP
jgi:hypothetical protein